ncbi:MAG: S1 family peptidase [Gammaproteobacteria bacterium]|nr:S1 family peptidase [Gammaproteobacteria bacterium]
MAKTLSRLAVTLAVTALFILAATPALAIDGGRPDHRAHKSVGILGFVVPDTYPANAGQFGLPPFEPGQAYGWCSGFVISDSAFVTAAHCITPVAGFFQAFGGATWVVSLEGGSPRHPVVPPGCLDAAHIFFSIPDFPLLVAGVAAENVFLHPDPVLHDIAVLRFAEGSFGVRPVRLPEEGALDELASRGVLDNMPVHGVGYGAGEPCEGGVTIVGYRQRALMANAGLDATGQRLLWQLPQPLWGALPGLGDSGGPVFLRGTVVALTSFGAFWQRLDTESSLEFLEDCLEGECLQVDEDEDDDEDEDNDGADDENEDDDEEEEEGDE